MAYFKLPRFRYWCQKVLPLVYEDTITHEEVLARMRDYLNLISKNQTELAEWLDIAAEMLEGIQEDIDYLTAELEKIKNGDYMSIYIEALAKWIDENLQELVARIVKYVFFGLSNDGRFVAYIPPAWNFIEFDTVIDPSSELNNHLVLRWS